MVEWPCESAYATRHPSGLDWNGNGEWLNPKCYCDLLTEESAQGDRFSPDALIKGRSYLHDLL